jgi:hypothetical protein
MSFTAAPVDGSATPIPMSSVVPDGTNTPLALEGGPSKSTGGNNLAPAAVYFYDGYHVTFGQKTDARDSHTDATSISAMQVWKQVSYMLQNPAALPAGTNLIGYTARSAVAVYSLASAAQTANGNSGDLTVGPYTEISIDINITANSGTSQTLQFFWERKGADGIYYALWQTNVITTTNQALSTSVGAGMAYNQSLGATGRLRWVITGTTPSYTFSANVQGK